MGRTTNNNNTSPGMEEYDPPPDTRGVLCQNNNNYSSSSGGDGDKTPGVISSLQGEERRIIKPSCPPPVKLSSSSPPLSVTRTQQLNSNNKLSSSSAETSFIIDGCKVERSRSSSSVLLHRRRDSNQLRVVATSATTGDLRQYVGDLNQSVVVSSTRDLTTKDLNQCVVAMPTSTTTARELSQCHVSNSSSSATRDDSCHLSQLYVSRRNSSSTTTASIIISRHGERRHDDGEQDGEEGEKDAAADSNNNDHAPPPDHHQGGGGGGGGGGEQRRTSAVEMLRRSLVSVSKSPSLNLNNNNRLQQHQRSISNTDANSNDRGLDRGRSGARIRAADHRRDECGDCQKKKKSSLRSEETTGDEGSTPGSTPPSDLHRVDSAPECFHTVSGTTTTSTSDGSLSAAGDSVREHVYCTVYCIVNDDRRSIAKTTDAEIKVVEHIDRSGERSGEEFESGREDEREEEDTAVYGSIPEPYTLDDLVDPLSGEEGGVGRAVRCCRVCLDDKAISPLHCCRKAVCGECLKMYVSSQVRVGRAYITCPIPECFGLLEEGLVVSHLANEEVGKYRYFLELSRLDSSTKPCPHCSLFTSLTTPPVTRETKYKIQCSKCQFVWCFKCHAPWHDGLKCRDYRRGDKLLRHWASVVEHGQRNAQKCPQCKIHIQRTEGCDHMTCTQCNTNFCYRCGERYRHLRFFGDHTSNLSVFGCKYRYLPDKPHLRRLVRGSVCGEGHRMEGDSGHCMYFYWLGAAPVSGECWDSSLAVSKVVIAPVVIVLVVVLGALSLVIGLLVFPVYYVCKRRRKQQQSQGSGRWI